MVPSPLEPRALAMRMRDLGTGCTWPDISWCGERRTHAKGLALDRNKIAAQTNAGAIEQEVFAITNMMLREWRTLKPCAFGAPLRGCGA